MITELKFFNVNTALDQRLCEVEFYQMPLSRFVDNALKTDHDFQNLTKDLLPSWAKTIAHPAKAKGFFTSMLAQIILGKGNFPEMNFSLQAGCPLSSKKDPRVIMMFLPRIVWSCQR